jgi:hypothetical protein
MHPVEEYLRQYLNTWQITFDTLSANEKASILSSWQKNYVYIKPIQVQVFFFKIIPKMLWIITHNEEPSLKIQINSEPYSDIATLLQNKFPEDFLEPPLPASYLDFAKEKNLHSSAGYTKNFTFIVFRENKMNEDPVSAALSGVDRMRTKAVRETESKLIGQKTEQIKSQAEKVQDLTQRETLLKATKDIELSLAKLSVLEQQAQKMNAIEGEIEGVRKLIGTSKEYQDWKILVEEVASFKKIPHVTKELFDSEIRRLDQRIDSLREIKFWSKRTALDLALAALATTSTIIAALLAAGLIHV